MYQSDFLSQKSMGILFFFYFDISSDILSIWNFGRVRQTYQRACLKKITFNTYLFFKHNAFSYENNSKDDGRLTSLASFVYEQ